MFPRGGMQTNLLRQFTLGRLKGIFAWLDTPTRQNPAVALKGIAEFANQPDRLIVF
jgi:hypothetical protein